MLSKHSTRNLWQINTKEKNRLSTRFPSCVSSIATISFVSMKSTKQPIRFTLLLIFSTEENSCTEFVKKVRVLIRNLILALEHLHSKNIMHRDLKPENLLLKSKNSDSEIVVADFGLATRIDIENILFKRCGTPGFVAPEVLLYKVQSILLII